LGGLGSRPQVKHESQTQNDPYTETFQTSPYISNSESRNSSYARKGVFVSPAVHRKQFTANNSPQGRFTAGQFTTEAIHRRAIHRKNNSPQEQFTANNSPQKKLKVGRFTAGAIHRRVNSPQVNSSQEQFTANNSPQKKIKSRAIHRRGNSPQTIHRRAIHRKQFTAIFF
jgi:hypothetical protein